MEQRKEQRMDEAWTKNEQAVNKEGGKEGQGKDEEVNKI
jgi:hypothetical protein